MARRQDGSEEVRRQNRKRAPRPRRRSRHPRSAANGAHQEEGDAGRRLSEVTEISVAEPGSRRKVASPPSRSLRSAIAIPSSLPKNPKSSMTVQIVPSPFLPPSSASRAHARIGRESPVPDRSGHGRARLVEPIELAAREIVSHGRAPSSWPLGFSFAGKIVDRLGGKNAGVHGGELRPHQGGDQRGQRLYPEENSRLRRDALAAAGARLCEGSDVHEVVSVEAVEADSHVLDGILRDDRDEGARVAHRPPPILMRNTFHASRTINASSTDRLTE